MITTLTQLMLAGITYSLNYDTTKEEYQVTAEGRLVSEVHVRKEFAEAKGLYTKLTQGK